MSWGFWTDFTKDDENSPMHIFVAGETYQTENHMPQGYPYYQLLITLDGAGKYDYQGRSVIQTAGCVIFPKPNEGMYLHPLSEKWQIRFLAFSGREAEELLAGIDFGAYVAKDPDRIASVIEKISELPPQRRQIHGRKLLRELLLSLKDILPSERILQEESRTENAFPRMFLYIQEHFAEKITLADLCNVSGYQKGTVNAIFRRRLGMTPVAYINKIRYKTAEEMLKSRLDLSVAEIAKQCGFPSLSYFYRNFSCGSTPLAFRKAYQRITVGLTQTKKK